MSTFDCVILISLNRTSILTPLNAEDGDQNSGLSIRWHRVPVLGLDELGASLRHVPCRHPARRGGYVLAVSFLVAIPNEMLTSRTHDMS